MNFLLVLALASLYESFDCETPFNISPKKTDTHEKFMLDDYTRYNYKFNNDCKTCLWLVGSDFDQAISTTAKELKREVYRKIRAKGHRSVTRPIRIIDNYKYPPFIVGRRAIKDDVCCPNGYECIANISWDGKRNFNLQGYSKYITQNSNLDNTTSPWTYTFSDNQFNIYHKVPGGTRRKFFVRQFGSEVSGSGGYKHPFVNGEKVVYITYGRLTPKEIRVTENGENGKLSYSASVLGYLDNQ